MSDDGCELLCIDLDHAEVLRARLPGADAVDHDAERLRALGDRTRLRLVHALRLSGQEHGAQGNSGQGNGGEAGELCVCDIAWIVGSSQGLVSHHLRQLRSAGLVASRRAGKLVMYRLTPAARTLTDVLVGEADPV